MTISTAEADLRERMARLEVQHKSLQEDLVETREVLHKVSSQLQALQAQLNALLNQGRGMGLVVKAFLALGGFGWLAGIISFFQQIQAFIAHK